MRVYVAASWTRSEEAKALALHLTERGHTCTSTWYDRKVDSYDLTHPDLPGQAKLDIDEVQTCDVLLCITGDTQTKGGRHTELGYALALHKTVLIFGPREQVFHWLPDVKVCHDLMSIDSELLQLDCAITRDILSLVDDGGPDIEDIKQWNGEQRQEVELWGGAIHFSASDNMDDCKACNGSGEATTLDNAEQCSVCNGEGVVPMTIPPRPAVLAKWKGFGPK